MQGEKGEDAIIPVGVDVTIIFKGLKGMPGRKGIPGGEGSDGSKGQYGDRVIIRKTYEILCIKLIDISFGIHYEFV